MLIAIIVVAVIIWPRDKPQPAAAPQPAPQPAAPKFPPAAVVLPEPAVSALATDLVSKAVAEPDQFDSTYQGKTVDVTGEIDAIKLDVSNRRFIAMAGGTERILGVRCFFAPANFDQLKGVDVGQKVVIRGRVEDREPNITLRECAIIAVP